MSTTYQPKELGRIARFEYGKSQTAVRSLDGTIPVYGTGGLMEYASAFLHPGPSVIVGRKGSLGNPLYSDGPFWAVDTTYYAAECDGSMRWLHYVLCSLRLENYNEATGVPSLARPTLNGIRVPCPSQDEQDGIVGILTTIDRAIEQTEALLAKQQRIKTGLMHDLLTRGLDAQGRLRDPSSHRFKPSPLGPIPEEWKVNPLRHYLRFISYGFTNPMPETPDGPFLVTAANINNGTIDFTSSRHTSENAFQKLLTAKSRPERNDILLTKDGSLGRLAMSGGEVICINQSVAILRVNDRVEPGFLKRLLEAEKYQALMLADAGGSTIKHLYITRVETLMIAIPGSPDERVQIERIIEAQDLAVDRLRATEHKLRRLKLGLMHDLLTGSVSVTPLLTNPTAPISP